MFMPVTNSTLNMNYIIQFIEFQILLSERLDLT